MMFFYIFGKKLVAIWVRKKLVKVNYYPADCYVSGDLKWVICFDSAQKKFAFFRIFKSTVDFYHPSHIKICDVEIFEGKSRRTISLPKTLIGALTGRLIGGKNATAILTGAAIGAASSSNLFGTQEVFIKKIFLFVSTTNNTYRFNFKPLLRSKTNDLSISEAMRWNKLINHI